MPLPSTPAFSSSDPDPDPAATAALLALRARAEQRRALVTQPAEQHSPQELQRLVQELQVHQIELEMQNEELLLAQAEAETARAQYADLYDFAPVGYFTLSATDLIEQLNLCGSQQLGSIRQLLVGQRFAQFVLPADRVGFERFLACVLATEGTVSCELALQREDGSIFFAQLEGLRVSSAASDDGDDSATRRCRLVVVDITVRQRTTEALAASEARFRKLFSESHDAVLLLQGSTYVDCNAAALRLLGATRREQVVGHRAWDFAPDTQPDGCLTSNLFYESVQEATRTGSKRCEVRMCKVTGETIWVEAVLTPIEQAGGVPLVHVLWRDVTAEREAAHQLCESEARLNLALAASETGVFARDLLTNLVQLDERAQAALGMVYHPAPVAGSKLAQCLHPDDLPRVRTALAEAVATNTIFTVDFRVVWPDGSVHFIRSAGRAVTDALGQVVSLAGLLRDVTALNATQEELHYKSLVLERLLSNVPMILTRFRPDGTCLEAMGVGFEVLGMEGSTLVGRNVFEEFPLMRAQMLSVLGGGQTRFLAELEVAAQVVAFQNYGFFDEQRQQAVVLSVNVTEAEQQKRQLTREKEFTQSLLEYSIDGIVALDREGCITAWNSQSARYFGYPAAQVLGQSLFVVLPHLDNEAARQVVGQVLAGEQVLLEGQAVPHRVGHFDVYHVPLRQAGEDQPTGILILFRDVTQRDRLAEETTRQRLRQQQEVLAAILDTQETERKRIAEALHNGLGQLLYATKLSLEGGGGGPRESLKLLEEAIRTTRTISFELTPGILEDFGLRTALEELVKRITPTGLPVRLHLTNLDQRLRLPVEITVYRVVQELLNNVMKHAAASEVVVHVARELGRVEVSVEDNGRGFAPAALASQPLAGIGLAGVRNRVALLGGELRIHSRLGRGTIISFEVNE